MRHVDWTKVRIIDMDGNPYYIRDALPLEQGYECEDCLDFFAKYVVEPESGEPWWSPHFVCTDCLIRKYERSTMDYADPDKFIFPGDTVPAR